MVKLFIAFVAVLAFVGFVSAAHGQTTSPSPTPTTSTVVPSGAPSTGFGR